jgi:hypothetical protein
VAAQWTGALKGHAFFADAANYLIDLDLRTIPAAKDQFPHSADVGPSGYEPAWCRGRSAEVWREAPYTAARQLRRY